MVRRLVEDAGGGVRRGKRGRHARRVKEGGNGVRVAWECGLRAAVGAERERGAASAAWKRGRKRVCGSGFSVRCGKTREEGQCVWCDNAGGKGKTVCAVVVPYMRLAAEVPFRSGKAAGNCGRTSAFKGAQFVFVRETGEKRETHTLFFLKFVDELNLHRV